MTIRSMMGRGRFAGCGGADGGDDPARASAQVTAVPREGVAFNDTVTQRVKIETVDPDDRTVAFTLPDGQVLVLPVDAQCRQPRRHPRRLDGQRHLHPDRDRC